MPGPIDHRLIKHIPALNELKIRRKTDIHPTTRIQYKAYDKRGMDKVGWWPKEGSDHKSGPEKGTISEEETLDLGFLFSDF